MLALDVHVAAQRLLRQAENVIEGIVVVPNILMMGQRIDFKKLV